MNEYIVYTTEGYTSGPKMTADVENCQVLGTIEGRSEGDAIKKLFKQNEWIMKAGFTLDNAFARPLLTNSIQENIRTVVDYLWKDEYTHFQENNYPQDHIFRVIKRLKNSI